MTDETLNPDRALARIRELTLNYDTLDPYQANELATLVIRLDTHITGGGVLPIAWNASHPPF